MQTYKFLFIDIYLIIFNGDKQKKIYVNNHINTINK